MSAKKYNPAMHTAEHLLNATMNKLFGCGRSFVSHIEEKKSKCDYYFDRSLTDEEVSNIEAEVNKSIEEDMKVEFLEVDRNEADRKYFTGKLPLDAGETIRIVKIGDYDACPCIGLHVERTGLISGFRIVSTDYKDGVLRIRFKLA